MKIMYKLLPIIHMLSKLSLLFSLLTFVPTTISHLFGDHAFMAFAETTFITVLVSLVVWLATYQYQRELRVMVSRWWCCCGWNLRWWRRCQCICILVRFRLLMRFLKP